MPRFHSGVIAVAPGAYSYQPSCRIDVFVPQSQHFADLYADAAQIAPSVPERDHLTREAARVRQQVRDARS